MDEEMGSMIEEDPDAILDSEIDDELDDFENLEEMEEMEEMEDEADEVGTYA